LLKLWIRHKTKISPLSKKTLDFQFEAPFFKYSLYYTWEDFLPQWASWVQNNKENKTGKLLNTQHHHFQKSSKDSLKSTHCLVFSLSPSTPILKNNVLFHFCFAFRQLFFAQNRPNRETMNNTSQILNLIPFIYSSTYYHLNMKKKFWCGWSCFWWWGGMMRCVSHRKHEIAIKIISFAAMSFFTGASDLI